MQDRVFNDDKTLLMHGFIGVMFGVLSILSGLIYRYAVETSDTLISEGKKRYSLLVLFNLAYAALAFLIPLGIVVLAFDWTPAHLVTSFLLIGSAIITSLLGMVFHFTPLTCNFNMVDCSYPARKERTLQRGQSR